jgi:hypothetical protein
MVMDMAEQQQRRPSQVQDGGQICQRCGGSGTLRLGDQSFRTCLDCLGQGRLPGLAAATTIAAVLKVDVVTQPQDRRRPLNGASVSASAAR